LDSGIPEYPFISPDQLKKRAIQAETHLWYYRKQASDERPEIRCEVAENLIDQFLARLSAYSLLKEKSMALFLPFKSTNLTIERIIRTVIFVHNDNQYIDPVLVATPSRFLRNHLATLYYGHQPFFGLANPYILGEGGLIQPIYSRLYSQGFCQIAFLETALLDRIDCSNQFGSAVVDMTNVMSFERNSKYLDWIKNHVKGPTILIFTNLMPTLIQLLKDSNYKTFYLPSMALKLFPITPIKNESNTSLINDLIKAQIDHDRRLNYVIKGINRKVELIPISDDVQARFRHLRQFNIELTNLLEKRKEPLAEEANMLIWYGQSLIENLPFPVQIYDRVATFHPCHYSTMEIIQKLDRLRQDFWSNDVAISGYLKEWLQEFKEIVAYLAQGNPRSDALSKMLIGLSQKEEKRRIGVYVRNDGIRTGLILHLRQREDFFGINFVNRLNILIPRDLGQIDVLDELIFASFPTNLRFGDIYSDVAPNQTYLLFSCQETQRNKLTDSISGPSGRSRSDREFFNCFEDVLPIKDNSHCSKIIDGQVRNSIEISPLNVAEQRIRASKFKPSRLIDFLQDGEAPPVIQDHTIGNSPSKRSSGSDVVEGWAIPTSAGIILTTRSTADVFTGGDGFDSIRVEKIPPGSLILYYEVTGDLTLAEIIAERLAEMRSIQRYELNFLRAWTVAFSEWWNQNKSAFNEDLEKLWLQMKKTNPPTTLVGPNQLEAWMSREVKWIKADADILSLGQVTKDPLLSNPALMAAMKLAKSVTIKANVYIRKQISEHGDAILCGKDEVISEELDLTARDILETIKILKINAEIQKVKFFRRDNGRCINTNDFKGDVVT
jgi:hypothetical protein